MDSQVELLIDGHRYGGWQQVRVRRSLERIAGSFRLSVTERWAGQDTPRPICPGAACAVAIDGERLVTGYVDEVGIRYGDTAHSVSVSGRDRAGDLVDCSAPAQEWQNQSLLAIASKLCEPFAIKVSAAVALGAPIPRVKAELGDSVFDVLEKLARLRAVLLISDGQGGLLITRAGAERTAGALVLGENILEAIASFSHKDRFSAYAVTGQRPGDDLDFGEPVSQVLSSVRDERITRHRPLIILAEGPVDTEAARARATWERNVRFGRSQRITYTVAGWRSGAELWQPNRLVTVRDDYLGMAAERLITEVELSLDETTGLRTTLTLMPPEALAPEPMPPAPDAESLGAT